MFLPTTNVNPVKSIGMGMVRDAQRLKSSVMPVNFEVVLRIGRYHVRRTQLLEQANAMRRLRLMSHTRLS